MIIVLTARIVQALKPFGIARAFLRLVTENEEFFEFDRVYNPFQRKIIKRLVLELPGKGCSWFKESGGCTMCGFNHKLEVVNQKWHFSAKDLTAFYEIADLLTRSEKPELLCVFNGGSFFNEDEIPLKTQLDIAKKVREHQTFQSLFVESRPEFITTESISRVRDALGTKKLEVGIGLEAVTDKVREVYIHKGFTLPDYEKAVKLLKSMGVYVLTYVFLKPLFLSEKEAVEEAIRTIEYAFNSGSDEVSLSCAFIQPGTLIMEKAYEEGKFSPPWLWSIIEVVKQTASLGPVRVGSFKDTPSPIAIPQNCSKCSKQVERALEDYNLSRQASIFNNLSCNCKKQWEQEISKTRG